MADMNIDIDQAADAVLISWAPRAPGRSVVGTFGGKSVRLLLNDANDVVGIEVLGWSTRTEQPLALTVNVTTGADSEILGAQHPLTNAASRGLDVVDDTGALLS
jgi:hypothetical protein